MLRAALAHAGAGACLSHVTAAALHGLMPMLLPGQTIDVTVPHGRRRRSVPGVLIHQSRRWLDIRGVGGLPVTGLAQTVIDLAAVLPPNDVRCVAADAVRLGLMDVAELQTEVVPSGQRRLVADMVVELRAGAASGPEMVVWRGIVEAQLPRPELNAPIFVAGRLRYLDGWWRALGLAYEIDGRDYHTKAAAFDADAQRNAEVAMEGILLVHVTANRAFSDLRGVIADLAILVDQRTHERNAMWALHR